MRNNWFIIYVLFCIFASYTTVFGVKISRQADSSQDNDNNNIDTRQNTIDDYNDSKSSKCWITLNAKQHFETMDGIDDKYLKVRNDYQKAIGIDKFDKEMLNTMVEMKGRAFRAIHNAGGDGNSIPAGINLGGYGMLRLDKSVLFFHRLKLRNNTRFNVNYLSNDFFNMTLTARLSLNDLHLTGSYERAINANNDFSTFIYTPTYGLVEFLLKDVVYKMEGRYRLLNDRLIIEHVISDIQPKEVIMNYANNATSAEPVQLSAGSLDEFLERLKTDINEWLKDYFNDYLMYFGLAASQKNDEYQKYDKEKTTALNDYVDDVVKTLRNRIVDLNAIDLNLPKFQFYGENGVEIELNEGRIRGLDTMYRRSVATSRKYERYRKVDVIVGFSKLKVDYKYSAVLSSTQPKLSGTIIMSADEMTAHMDLILVEEPESIDLNFDCLQQMKPESLTIDGPANRMISNFKHLLEHHIIAVMTNTIVYSVKQLTTLAKCEPFLPGQLNGKNIKNDKVNKNVDQDKSKKIKTNIPDNSDIETNNETKNSIEDSQPVDKTDDKSHVKAVTDTQSSNENKGVTGSIETNIGSSVELLKGDKNKVPDNKRFLRNATNILRKKVS